MTASSGRVVYERVVYERVVAETPPPEQRYAPRNAETVTNLDSGRGRGRGER